LFQQTAKHQNETTTEKSHSRECGMIVIIIVGVVMFKPARKKFFFFGNRTTSENNTIAVFSRSSRAALAPLHHMAIHCSIKHKNAERNKSRLKIHEKSDSSRASGEEKIEMFHAGLRTEKLLAATTIFHCLGKLMENNLVWLCFGILCSGFFLCKENKRSLCAPAL
jgi:hypothetical protein